jgi:hypothetical protein
VEEPLAAAAAGLAHDVVVLTVEPHVSAIQDGGSLEAGQAVYGGHVGDTPAG